MSTFKRSFTLVEMLVVIAIIAILAGILLPVLNSARTRARETNCANNLKQMAVSTVAYRQDWGGDKRYPGWLSNLYQDYLKNKDVYKCSADQNQKTTAAASWKARADDHWQEVYDRTGNTGKTYNPDTRVGNVSYFYEFSDVECGWFSKSFVPDISDPTGGNFSSWKPTWQQVKIIQMRKGDSDHPSGYQPDKFPITRCFWHIDDIEDYNNDIPNSSRDYSTGGIPNAAKKVINVSINGNVFYSTAKWEEKTWSP